MAPELRRLVEQARPFVADFILSIDPRWSASATEHRSLLRAAIRDDLKLNEDISNLASPPRIESHSISISHTDGIGGWAATPRPWQVGLDLEQLDRIQPKLIARIASPNEIQNSPDPRFLWSAKESIFKAFEVAQPTTINQTQVADWCDLGGGLYSFRGLPPYPCQGFFVAHSLYILSVCLYKNSVSF